MASELADNGFRLFQGEWRHRRNCPENYNSVSGAALDQPDTDSFYGWGALMPAIAVAEATDINPWGGWEVTHGASICLGPLQTPLGLATIESGDGVLRITVKGEQRFATGIPGRMTHLNLGPISTGVTLPPGPAGWVEIPGAPIKAATLDGRAIKASAARIEIPAREQAQRLEILRGAI